MKVYENLDNVRRREQTLEITLQSGEFKGKLRTKVISRSFGLNILNIVDDEIIYNIDDYEAIDCDIQLLQDDEGEYWFKYVLQNDNGDACEGEDECRYFNNLIVGINIVDSKILED